MGIFHSLYSHSGVKQVETLSRETHISSCAFVMFKVFRSISNSFVKGKIIDYRIVRWKTEHGEPLSSVEELCAKIDLMKLQDKRVGISDYISKWGTSFLKEYEITKKMKNEKNRSNL